MRARLALGGVAVFAALTAFGCSGGGTVSGALAPPKGASPATARATFRITIPIVPGSNGAKRPAYVSPSTRSVTFSGSGITTQTVALVASGPNCPIDGSGTTYTCSTAFDGPIGSSTLSVATYGSTDGTGSPLSINSVPISIVGGQDNAIGVSLNGVAATLTLALTGATTLTNGTAATQTATWGAKDAAGNTIVGPGSIVDASNSAIAPSLTSADAGGHLTVGSQTGNAWAVAYDGGAISTSKLTLSATGLTSVSAATTIQALSNADFEKSSTSYSPWFPCYAQATAYGSVDASPAPTPTPGSLTTATAAPAATPPPATESGVAQSVPAGASTSTPGPSTSPTPVYNGTTASVHGGANAARVGFFDYSLGIGKGKGLSGICQTVTVPHSASLSLYLYEGANTNNFAVDNHLGMIFTGNPFTTTFASGTVAGQTAYKTATGVTPAATLFAQSNCYNTDPGRTADVAACAIGSGAGGTWLKKGPYDLSAYSGQITLFLGQYGSTASTTTYSYVYFDDVSLSGPGT